MATPPPASPGTAARRPPVPPSRVGGPVLPGELRYWYSRNAQGRPTGSAGLIPITRDDQGHLRALVVIELRPKDEAQLRARSPLPKAQATTTPGDGDPSDASAGVPFCTWLAGKRQAVNGRDECPAETALREAAEESFDAVTKSVVPVAASALALSGFTVWVDEAKQFLYLWPVPWTADLFERTRQDFATGRAMARAIPDAEPGSTGKVDALQSTTLAIEWVRLAELSTAADTVAGAQLSHVLRRMQQRGLLRELEFLADHLWAVHDFKAPQSPEASAVDRSPASAATSGTPDELTRRIDALALSHGQERSVAAS